MTVTVTVEKAVLINLRGLARLRAAAHVPITVLVRVRRYVISHPSGKLAVSFICKRWLSWLNYIHDLYIEVMHLLLDIESFQGIYAITRPEKELVTFTRWV